MANTKRVPRKQVEPSHPAYVPANSSPLANVPVVVEPSASNTDPPQPTSTPKTEAMGIAGSKWSAETNEGVFKEYTGFESDDQRADKAKSHEEVQATPGTEPLSPKSAPLSALINLSLPMLPTTESLSISNAPSPVIERVTRSSTAPATPDVPSPSSSVTITRASKRLSQSTPASTPPPNKKIKTDTAQSISISNPTVNQYILACVSCERLVLAHSTATLAPEVLWSKDRLIPVCCNTCATIMQDVPTSWAPESAGLRMRLHPHIVRNWELHRLAHKAFGLSLSDSEGVRPVWTTERAWAILRAGEEEADDAPALTAESIILDRTDGQRWGETVKRYRLLKNLQRGFLTETDTETVVSLLKKEELQSGLGKWVVVPGGM